MNDGLQKTHLCDLLGDLVKTSQEESGSCLVTAGSRCGERYDRRLPSKKFEVHLRSAPIRSHVRGHA